MKYRRSFRTSPTVLPRIWLSTTYVYAAYEIIKSIHPEVAGFQITLKETGGGNAVTSIDLLKLEEES